jgi:DNA ligase-1
MIKKPMKAPGEGVSLEVLKNMPYPIACSPKLDGIRALALEEGIMSATKKPLGNLHMQACLDDESLIGLDGELVVGLPYADPNDSDDDVFNRTSGAIRRSSGEPDFKYYVFDDFTNPNLSYQQRWAHYTETAIPVLITNPYVVILEQKICHNFEEAVAYEEKLILKGYEGMMARTLTSVYKQGRVTLKEGHILKRKPLEQDEAVVVGVYEQLKNNNTKVKDALGNGVRSSHKDNKVGKGTLGGITLKSPKWAETFNCGTIIGGTTEWRQEMWNNQDKILGATMTYVYQGYGSIDKPRQPRAKSEFRPKDDITNY